VGRVDHLPVAFDVPALAADREDDEFFVARVPEAARCPGLDVAAASRAELEPLSFHLEVGPAAVDEVELVLLLVEMVEPLGGGREDERVGAEGPHAELAADLAEDAVAHVVDRSMPMSHGRYRRRPCSSASKSASASSPAR